MLTSGFRALVGDQGLVSERNTAHRGGKVRGGASALQANLITTSEGGGCLDFLVRCDHKERQVRQAVTCMCGSLF